MWLYFLCLMAESYRFSYGFASGSSSKPTSISSKALAYSLWQFLSSNNSEC